MAERNNIQLAIGYGIGAGMALAGLLVLVGQFALSFFEIGTSAYLIGGVIVLGGIAIAVINALKLDQSAISDIEKPSE